MPIPQFDQRGNLSVGRLIGRHGTGAALSLVPVTLDELHDRFVRKGHTRRAMIWQGWMRHRQLLDELPIPYITLVDGSFITAKREPEDVDLCVLFDAAVVNGLTPDQRDDFGQVMDHDRAKREFLLDLYMVAAYPFIHPRYVETTLRNLTYWTRVFGIDRLGYQKSVLAVSGGGVL